MTDRPAETSLPTEITSRLRTTEHTTIALRAVRREYSRRIREAEGRSVIRLAMELQRAEVVHRFFGDDLIANHKGR